MRHYKLKLHELLGWRRKKNQRGKIALKQIRMIYKNTLEFINSPFLIRQQKWRVSTSRNSPFFMRQYKWRVST